MVMVSAFGPGTEKGHFVRSNSLVCTTVFVHFGLDHPFALSEVFCYHGNELVHSVQNLWGNLVLF